METDNNPRIQVLKVTGHEEFVGRSLREGVARMSWGYLIEDGSAPRDGDMGRIRRQIEADGWNSLAQGDKDRHLGFLLELGAGDWIVYVNMPSYGRCIAARVTGDYYWDAANHSDCNHCLPIDLGSIIEFDRNDARVHPALSARLKLQGRSWRITVPDEFRSSLAAVRDDPEPRERTVDHGIDFWLQEIEGDLVRITQALQSNHPNYDLEKLLEAAFRRLDRVIEVERRGGASDHGADLLVTFRGSSLIPSLERPEVCVVQVKSYTGTHSNVQAVRDIERAFEHYPEATQGLIVSTAERTAPEFDAALDDLATGSGKPVAVLVGKDVALFVIEAGIARSVMSGNEG